MSFTGEEIPGHSQDSPPARPDAATLVHEKVLSLLRPERPGRLLDVPAGEGALAEQARLLGHEVWCGDLDPSRFRVQDLDCAKVDLNAPWPFSHHFFDYVVSIEAIEHLENPWHLVREAHRVLKDHGTFIVTTPNILTIKSRLSYLLNGYPNYFHFMVEHDRTGREQPVDHINPVGFLELRHILARTGFLVDLLETNRYLKPRSLLFQALRMLLKTRGRSKVRAHPAKAEIRNFLLSKPLLFGEVLILRSRKTVGGRR